MVKMLVINSIKDLMIQQQIGVQFSCYINASGGESDETE